MIRIQLYSVKADGTGGIVEYVATFPNTTVKNGDTYKACALTIKDSNLICKTGTNSPALRPEFKDLYIQGERPAASQAAKISDVWGPGVSKRNGRFTFCPLFGK